MNFESHYLPRVGIILSRVDAIDRVIDANRLTVQDHDVLNIASMQF